jgi:hypothetical protein
MMSLEFPVRHEKEFDDLVDEIPDCEFDIDL